MRRPPAVTISRRLFALLPYCFPRSFRERFGEEMRELFDDQLHAAYADARVRGILLLWLRTLPPMGAAILLETGDALRAALRRTVAPPPGTFVALPPARGERMLSTLATDLRFAVRMLRKSPVFTVVAVVCIAIGSGAVATIFSAMNSLVLRPLPGAANAGALVRMERKAPGRDDGTSASYPLYERLRTQARTLDGVAAWGKAALVVRTGSEEGVSVYGNFVSGNFFGVLGVRPLLGRLFSPEETRTELTHPVIVVSERFWRARLGADSGAVGRVVAVNGYPYTIVGVVPGAFEGLDAPIRTDAWVPLMMQAQIRQNAGPLSSPDVTWLRLCGRLRSGASAETAQAELSRITSQFVSESAEPKDYRSYTEIRLSPLTGLPPDATRPLTMFLALLLGAAGLVLLIASVNVASMLGARAIARRREMAVRSALGASRGRLVRQLLTEILVLFALGAVGGTMLATVATALLERITIPGPLPIALELSPDWRVLAFALVVSLVSGLAFGLAPALRSAGADIAVRMRADSHGGGSRRTLLGSSLVVGQLALSLLLLVGAGLFLRALERGARIDPGFDASGVATVALNTESWGYSSAKGRAFYRQLREQIETLPGVTSVSYAVFLPLTLQSNGTSVAVDGGDGADAAGGIPVRLLKVGPDYFSTVGMPLVAGRGIGASDDERAPKVVVVNETLARRHFPNGDAIGRTIGHGGERLTIVGVARDAKYSTLTEELPAFVYFPLEQQWEPRHTFIVRTSLAEPLTLAPALAAAIRSVDPGAPRPVVSTLQRENAAVLLPQRVAAIVTASLGAVGLLLATVGLYGVVSYSAGRRSREIGIRLALGARPAEVRRLIVGEGMRLTIVGIVVGLVLAAGLTRLLVRFLFGISPLDSATFVVMSLTLAGIAALASYLPARRASGTNPMVVLRGD